MNMWTRAAAAAGAIAMSLTAAGAARADFAGLYLGLHGGWGASQASSSYVNNSFNPPNCGYTYFWGCPVDVDPEGGFIGGQAGFNAVLGSGLMLGVEGDYSFANLVDSGVGVFQYGKTATEVVLTVDQLATIQGRVGFVHGRVMPFLTLGYGWAHAERSAFNPDTIGPLPSVDTRWHSGLTVGGGLEIAVNDHLSIKGEYRFFNGSTEIYSLAFANGTAVDLDIHTFRVGFNYNF